MASNVREFNLSIDEFIDKEVPEAADKVMRAALLEGARGLVLSTPVDKGRARGGWEVELQGGARVTRDQGILDPTGTLTLTRAIAKIRRAKGFALNYISNAVPYINELEDGSSSQAPAGMVRVTVNRLRVWLQLRRAAR